MNKWGVSVPCGFQHSGWLPPFIPTPPPDCNYELLTFAIITSLMGAPLPFANNNRLSVNVVKMHFLAFGDNIVKTCHSSHRRKKTSHVVNIDIHQIFVDNKFCNSAGCKRIPERRGSCNWLCHTRKKPAGNEVAFIKCIIKLNPPKIIKKVEKYKKSSSQQIAIAKKWASLTLLCQGKQQFYIVPTPAKKINHERENNNVYISDRAHGAWYLKTL